MADSPYNSRHYPISADHVVDRHPLPQRRQPACPDRRRHAAGRIASYRHRLASEVMLINQISEYIISAGGKRLRPALLLLVAGARWATPTGHRHELAAVVEFIHTATLLHDDVVDESDLRRGRQTANALFGNAASVLVGDFLYSRSFQMMVGVGKMRVMEILSDATNVDLRRRSAAAAEHARRRRGRSRATCR